MESFVLKPMTLNIDFFFFKTNLIIVSTFSRNVVLIDQFEIFWSVPMS